MYNKIFSVTFDETFARACGMKRVYVCDPFDQTRLLEIETALKDLEERDEENE